MRFVPLASSSAGNAYLVEDGEGNRLLLECGLTHRKLRRLAGEGLRGLAGCLITHEHKDHARCWSELIRDGARVWASVGTREALDGGLIQELPEGEEGYLPFRLGPFDVLPFPTFHDAAQPVGYLIRSRTDGEKLAFATDTVNLRYRFPDVTIFALEANYDAEILARSERMPDKVKKRVTNSHMEIGRLCGYLQGADLIACREVWLLHLSDASADEGDFVRRVQRVVPPRVRVAACQKEGAGYAK